MDRRTIAAWFRVSFFALAFTPVLSLDVPVLASAIAFTMLAPIPLPFPGQESFDFLAREFSPFLVPAMAGLATRRYLTNWCSRHQIRWTCRLTCHSACHSTSRHCLNHCHRRCPRLDPAVSRLHHQAGPSCFHPLALLATLLWIFF